MPHRISSVGNIDIIDNDCIFVIPAINDTTRVLEKCVYNVASFKSDNPYKPGTPVFLHGRNDESWYVSKDHQNSEGFVGVVVENNLSEKSVSVQLTGAAWVPFPTDIQNVGKYILYDGTMDNGSSDLDLIIGKITGVPSKGIYEVLLHSLPRPEAKNKKVVKGIPFASGTKTIVNGSDNMWYSSQTFELSWSGADSGQGFSIVSGTSTPIIGGTGAGVTLTFPHTYVAGLATASTWGHQAVPKDPAPAETIAVSCKIDGKILTIFAPPTKAFYNYGPFKMRVIISGWMK